MRINIAERLRPFEHIPGTLTMLPGTTLCFQIFPTLIRIFDLSVKKKEPHDEIAFSLKGPLQKFTVQLDLENGCIRVWGDSPEGFLRYRIHSLNSGDGFALIIEKSPKMKVIYANHKFEISQPEHTLTFSRNPESETLYSPPETDRLSLGSNKSQEWPMVQRRGDFKEIFPIWLRLGQLLPPQKTFEREGTAALLNTCQKVLQEGNPAVYLQPFVELSQVGFEGILVPRLEDEQHQGFNLSAVSEGYLGSPISLLTEGALLIRSMFIQANGSRIFILPALPSEFHCGRLTNISIEGVGKLDLEWSKKMIRRMILHADHTSSIEIIFHKSLNRCRLRMSKSDRGNFIQIPASLQIEKGSLYLFDNFQK